MLDMDDVTFSVTVGGKVSTVNLSSVVGIDDTNLSGEFSGQASLQAWWGVLYEQSAHAFKLQEIDFEAEAARIGSTIRTKLSAAQEKKPTEDQLKEQLKADPVYVAKRKQLEGARYNMDLLKLALRSVEERGRMLISYGAHKRSEMEMQGLSIVRKATGGGR